MPATWSSLSIRLDFEGSVNRCYGHVIGQIESCAPRKQSVYAFSGRPYLICDRRRAKNALKKLQIWRLRGTGPVQISVWHAP